MHVSRPTPRPDLAALSANDKAFYIAQAKARLQALADERRYHHAVYEERALRRRRVMLALRLAEQARTWVQFGRAHFRRSRWGSP